jgi:hypothetical protein
MTKITYGRNPNCLETSRFRIAALALLTFLACSSTTLAQSQSGAGQVNLGEVARQETILQSPVTDKTVNPPAPALHPKPNPLRPAPDKSLLTTSKITTTQLSGISTPQSLSPQSIGDYLSSKPTPQPTLSFPALRDNGAKFEANPSGAVGTNHLMVATENQIIIQNRAGVQLTNLTLDGFWSRIGVSNVYSPRVLYDPYFSRWIMAARAFPTTNTQKILLGVSQTSDPTGNWNLYSSNIVSPRFPDSLSLGFNKYWIVLQSDIADNTSGFLTNSSFWVFNKTNVYAGGTGKVSTYLSLNAYNEGWAHVPATTYDPDEPNLYLMNVYDSSYSDGYGWIKIYKITGTPSSPSLSDSGFTSGYAWAEGADIDNFLPQAGNTNKLYAGDSRIQSVVFRDSSSSLFACQTIFLPTNGVNRCVIRFWEALPGGTQVQQSTIDTPGEHFYAYPSLSVNSTLDVLLAYSRFASNQYPSASYSVHVYTRSNAQDVLLGDNFSEFRADTLLKAGEDSYVKTDTNRAAINFWGGYSATVIDPINDSEMWTLQPYASTNTAGKGRWGLWWTRITPPANLGIALYSQSTILAGYSMTNFIYVTNNFDGHVDDVVVTNTLPPGASLVSVTVSQGSYVYTNGQVIFSLGSLNDGGLANAAVILTPAGVGMVTNVATVGSRGPDEDPSDNISYTYTTVRPTADLGVTVSGFPTLVNVGVPMTNTVQVTNRGPYTATGVVVTNTYPATMTIGSISASMGTVTRSGNVITWTVNNNLSVGANPVLSYDLTPTVGGQMANVAVIITTSVDPQPANNAATNITRANAFPTIQTLTARTVNEDVSTGPISFTVGDLETPASSLAVYAFSSNESLVPNANIQLGGSASNRTITITPLPALSGTATITRYAVDGDGATNSSAFVLTVAAVNDPPTLDPISNLTINEDASTQTVPFGGISGGPANESQTVSVTATSSIPSITGPITVNYAGGAAGSLSFTPVANAYGTATITVFANDGGASNNLASQSFTVTVNPVNDPPTLNSLSDVVLNEDTGLQTNALTGISGGPANESQSVTITASNSNPALLTGLTVNYTSGASGTLTYSTLSNAFGTATITVLVVDNAGSNNIVSRSYNVTVYPVNDFPALNSINDLVLLEDASSQTIPLTGISSGAANESQTLSVTVSNSGSGLLANLTSSYTSPDASGSLSFDILPNSFGTNLLTVKVQDDGASNNIVTRTFKVVVIPVNDPPTLDSLSNLSLNEDFGLYIVNLTGITAGAGNEPADGLTVSAISDNPSIIPSPVVIYTAPAGTGMLQLNSIQDGAGSANITVTVYDAGTSNNTITHTFQVTVSPANDFPTLNPIANVTIPEDAGFQTVNLSGISSGAANETQTLSVTASNGTPGLLTNVQVSYTSPAGTAMLSFSTVSNSSGNGTITVFVSDGGDSNNIVSQSFTVFITPVNDAPGMDTPANLNLDEDFGTYLMTVTGINSGPPNEPQLTLSITATSSVPLVIPNPVVNYTMGASTVTLQFTSMPNASGTATITVKLDDGGGSNNITLRTFTVTVLPVNDLPTISTIDNQTMDENTSLTVPFTVWDIETAANRLVLSAISFNEEVITPAGVSFSGSGTNRTMSLHPLTNQYGSATLAIMVQDTDGGNAYTIFDLNVNYVSTPPMISPVANQSLGEDGSLVVPFTVSDAVVLSSNIVVTVSNSNPSLLPPEGFVLTRTSTNCLLNLTPAPDQFGSATITITADNLGLSNNISSLSFVANIYAVNDAPTMDPLAGISLNEDDGMQTIILTGISAGPVNEIQTNLLLAAISDNTSVIPHPVISYTNGLSTATLRLTPVANAFGTANITITVNDGGSSNNIITRAFQVIVNAVNDFPTLAVVSSVSIDEDSGLQTVPLSGISAGPNESQVITITGSNSNPALLTNLQVNYASPASTGTITFGTVSNSFGTAVITVLMNDNGGSNNTITFAFSVTVHGVNDAPTLNPIGNISLDEDFGIHTISLLGISSGADNEFQTLTVTAVSSNTAVLPNPIVSYNTPDATATLQLNSITNANGAAVITVTVNDNDSPNNIVTRSFTVTVNSVNDLPTISSIGNQSTDEDTTVVIPFVIGDTETAAASLVLSNSFSNSALLSTNSFTFGGSGSNRTVSIRPLTNQFGTAVITLTVRDTDGGSASTTFNLTVNPVNDPPVISAISAQSTGANSPATVNFTIGDLENAPGDLLLAGSSSNPSLIPQNGISFGGSGSNRSVTLTPLLNQVGAATISISVVDTNGATAASSFVLTVTNVATPPAISALPSLTINEDTVAGPLSFTVSDLTTPLSNLVVSAASSSPTLIPPANIVLAGTGPDRTATITPVANLYGSSTITLTVSDGASSNSASFLLTVAPVNDPPTLNAISNLSINQDSGLQTVPLSGISSGPNETNTLTISAISSNPSLIPNPAANYTNNNTTGILTFTPVAHATGAVLITVTVNDNAGSNNLVTRTFVVTVNPVNTAPTIAAISAQTILEDTAITVPFTIADAESSAAILIVTGASTNATLVPSTNLFFEGNGTNRTLTIVPATNQFGTTLITLTVSDGAASANASFLLTVNAVNDAPTLNPILPFFWKSTTSAIATNITLSGISAGATNEGQTVTVTVSNYPTSFYSTQPSISYTNPNTSGILKFTINSYTTGTNMITVTVTDGGASNNITQQRFMVYSRSSSTTNPVLAGITNLITTVNTATPAIPFTISPGTSVNLVGLSSNPSLIPNTNIIFGGSGTSRTLTLIPATNATGVGVVTISLINPTTYAGTNRVITLTINPTNSSPSISTFSNLAINEDTNTGPIAFTISDEQTPADDLIVTASSSNPTLVPNGNIILGGSGTNRALFITPAANQNGTATVSVVVSDGVLSRTNSFVLTVNSLNDLPSISAIADQRISAGSATSPIAFTIGDLETAAASLTLAATSSNTGLVPNANVTFGGSASNRTVTVTPVAGQSGVSTITVTVSDGQGGSVNAAFLLTVDPGNNLPTLNAISDVVISRAPGSNSIIVSLAGITAGGESQPLNVTASSSNPALVPNPVVSYTTPNTTGTLTLTAMGITNGSVVITVTVNDGQAPNNILTRSFNAIVNSLPALSNIPVQTVAENNSSAAIPIVVSDPETPAANLTLAGYSRNTSLVPNGNIQFGGTGSNRTVTITPAPSSSGSTWIDLVVTDGNGATATNSFLIEVLWANDPPTLAAISNQNLPEDFGQLDILLSGISAGLNESQNLTITVSSTNLAVIPTPAIFYTNGNTTGYLRLTSIANVSGTSLINITVDDGAETNNTVTRSFLVTVSPVNDSPTLASISDVTINEDTGLQTIPLSGISSGAANENQVLVVTALAENTNLLSNVQVTYTSPSATGTLTFGTVSKAFGSTTITVSVNDQGASNNIVTRTFNVMVNPINDPPSVNPIADQVLNEDFGQQDILLTGISAGPNESQPLSFLVTSTNPAVIPTPVVFYTNGNTTGYLRLISAPNASGTSLITVQIDDGAGANNTFSQAFLVTVNPVNDSPTLASISDVSINEDAGLQTIPLSGISSGAADENQVLLVTAVAANTNLLRDVQISYSSPSAIGSLSFGTVSNASGATTITVTVNDQAGSNNVTSRTFNVTVNPINDTPVISYIPDASTLEDVSLMLGFNAFDVETPADNLIYTALSDNQSLIADSGITLGGSGTNRTITFQPLPNQYGTAGIAITVQDPQGASVASRLIQITVIPVNDAPTISTISAQTMNANGILTVAFTVADLETTEASLQVAATTTDSTLLPPSALVVTRTETNRLLTISPAAGKSGSADITLTVNDGGSSNNFASRTFTLTVNPVPTNTNDIQLVIRRAGARLVLAWSTNAGHCDLQARLDCTPTNWTTLSVAPVIVSGEYQVTIDPTGPSMIYRLLSQPATTAPSLQINVSGGAVLLSWPADATGFALQARTNVVMGSWTTLGVTPVISNGMHNVSINSSEAAQFYRLIK